ncbi:lipopolysaccharide biosynthesis protein RfbH [Clostridia bacterium]|nr:lipopolysaccharide biosynthesis protein RfbH [Clostridia bacterium]
MKTEKELRAEILLLVREYYGVRHVKKPFAPGDYINYAGRVFDSDEIESLVSASLDFWLTSGEYTDCLEKGLADYIGVRFCSFVNSGSSANLLAFMTLTSHLLGERAVLPGDEVITVACGFPTTIAPIVQYGAVPVFADITIPQYNIDVNALESAYSTKTKAVFIAHTLGNPFDVGAVRAFCDKYNLWLIEDNCDALGSEYTDEHADNPGAMRKTGGFGHIGTSSFYPAHHMTTGEGGAVYTDDPLLHKICRSMRDWGRDCSCASGQDNLCGRRYDGVFGTLPSGYDHKYVYSHLGYNLKATDLQAAIGCVQLGKLDSFTASRRRNFALLRELLSDCSDKLILPEACPGSNPSWFGFLITCNDAVRREELVRKLEAGSDTVSPVQTRMLFAGNILRQPCFTENRNFRYRTAGELRNTDIVMKNTFWLGVYPGMNEEMIHEMSKAIHLYIK